jgi:hypothetical protein
MTRLVNPRFRVAGMLYEGEGGAAASASFLRAGLESVRAHPARVSARTLASLRSYLTTTAGELAVDWRSDRERRAQTLRTLLAIDAIRARTSALFGGDAHWPVARLAEGPPIWGLDWPHPSGHPPAWVFTTMLVAGVGWVFVRRCWSGILATALCLLGTMMVLTAFSQDVVLRYWLSWTVVLSLALSIELAAAAGRDRPTGPLPRAAI